MNISSIAKSVPASPIRRLAKYADQAKKRGITVYHLNIGDPDIKTPTVMIDVLKHWSQNPIGYSSSHGEEAFLRSLQTYYKNLGFNLELSNIQSTIGGSEGVLWSFMACCNPGDEILTFEPLYANYISYSIMTGVNLVPILTSIDTGFHLPDAKIIEGKISKKTKAILICNPSNPTGTVYTKSEMDMLVNIAKKYGLYLLSDEVYREFVYNEKKSVTALSYTKEYPAGIVVIDSLSKRFSLCGARVGCLVSFNLELMESFLKFAQARLSAGLVDQLIAAKLIEVRDSYFHEVVKEYRIRRDAIVAGLREIPGVVCPMPEGAFYLIVKLPVPNAERFAQWLLTDFENNKETVMVAPASGFYLTSGLGVNQIRIAYVLNTSKIKRSVELIRLALERYNKLIDFTKFS